MSDFHMFLGEHVPGSAVNWHLATRLSSRKTPSQNSLFSYLRRNNFNCILCVKTNKLNVWSIWRGRFQWNVRILTPRRLLTSESSFVIQMHLMILSMCWMKRSLTAILSKLALFTTFHKHSESKRQTLCYVHYEAARDIPSTMRRKSVLNLEDFRNL